MLGGYSTLSVQPPIRVLDAPKLVFDEPPQRVGRNY